MSAAEEEIVFCYKCKAKEDSSVPVRKCVASKCVQMVCDNCFSAFCETQKLPLLVKDGVAVVSTYPNKKCYNAGKKTVTTEQPQRLHWEQDGNGGPKDPMNSMRILLNWITTEGNYTAFCGNNLCKPNYGVH